MTISPISPSYYRTWGETAQGLKLVHPGTYTENGESDISHIRNNSAARSHWTALGPRGFPELVGAASATGPAGYEFCQLWL